MLIFFPTSSWNCQLHSYTFQLPIGMEIVGALFGHSKRLPSQMLTTSTTPYGMFSHVFFLLYLLGYLS